jgi:hypothetical protein
LCHSSSVCAAEWGARWWATDEQPLRTISSSGAAAAGAVMSEQSAAQGCEDRAGIRGQKFGNTLLNGDRIYFTYILYHIFNDDHDAISQ